MFSWCCLVAGGNDVEVVTGVALMYKRSWLLGGYFAGAVLEALVLTWVACYFGVSGSIVRMLSQCSYLVGRRCC